MTRIVYEVVEHDGGWAYRVNGVFSETFSSHDLAHSAAERAAKEQVVPGDPTGISYEDKDGRWHDEASPGGDRPETDVEAEGIFRRRPAEHGFLGSTVTQRGRCMSDIVFGNGRVDRPFGECR